MKIYHRRLAFRITALIALSVGIGLCIAYGLWWEIVLLIPCAAIAVYSLICLTRQTTDDFKRLIGGIRYSDFSVSFRNLATYGGNDELGEAMDEAIACFNRRAQKQESELAFYEILLNRIDFAIFTVNPDGEIAWINKHAQDLIGRPHPAKISDLRMLSPEAPAMLEMMSPKDTKVIRIKTGQEERNLIVTMVIIQIRGQAIRVFSFKNIQQVIDDTESEAWKKLIRILTHEMTNSITPIISLAETFSESDGYTSDPGMMHKAMSTIHRRSKGLLRFVNNYQRLTRIPPPQPSAFFASEMLEDIAHLLKAQGIQFTIRITPPDIQLYADRAQLEQVLINLIKNGAEACAGKENPHVEAEVKKDEYRRPVIAVTDNGTGILPEVQDKVFIPFFSTKKEGSGIGLSVCRQIIKNHGGRISLTSRPEEGSRFEIQFT